MADREKQLADEREKLWRKQHQERAERDKQFWDHHLKQNQQMLKQQLDALAKPRTNADYLNERAEQTKAAGKLLQDQINRHKEKEEQERRDKELTRQALEKFLRQGPRQPGAQAKKKKIPDKNRKRDQLVYEGRDLTPEEFGRYAAQEDIPPLKPKEGDPPWPGWPKAVTHPVFKRKIVNLRDRVNRKFARKGR